MNYFRTAIKGEEEEDNDKYVPKDWISTIDCIEPNKLLI